MMANVSLGSNRLDDVELWFCEMVQRLEKTHDNVVARQRVSTCKGHVIAICCAWDETVGHVRGFLGETPQDSFVNASHLYDWSVVNYADVVIGGTRTPELTFQWLWEEAKEAARHDFWLN